jgi:hypothetical protein
MCFSRNSLVAMSDFSYKPIDQVRIGEHTLGFDLQMDTSERRNLKIGIAIYLSNRKDECIQLDLDNGKSIQLTRTQNVLGRPNGAAFSRWAPAGTYLVGDIVQVFQGYDAKRKGRYFGTGTITNKKQLIKQPVYMLDTLTKTYIVDSVAVRTTY